ncbi:MAG: porin [Prolixibacteraceae bacterium]
MKNSFNIGLLVLMLLSAGNLLKGQTHIISAVGTDSVRYNAYGQKVSRISAAPEYRNGILSFETPDQMFRTWFDLRVNFDGAYYFDKNALNPIGSGVTLRRLRFAMKTVLYKHWTGEVDLNFANGLDVKDAFLGYRDDDLKFYFKAGYFKEPICTETTTTSRYQTFIEEPYMTVFAPARQLGIGVSKWDQHYLAAVGVHFQDVENSPLVTFTQDINKANGTDEGYSLTGKFVFKPISEPDRVIHLGVSGSYRTPKTSFEFPNTVRYSSRDMTSVNRKKYLDSDDIAHVKSNILLGGELYASFKNIKFSSEYLQTTVNRETGFSNYKANGMYASVAYMWFGGKYRYNDEEGEFTQVSRGRKWGDIETAIRFDYINFNDQTAQIMGGSANSYTAGITYHINYNVKFMLNYSFIDHDRYANGKGKLFSGHDSSGNLTSDYSKITESAGKGGDDYGFIQARVEIDF